VPTTRAAAIFDLDRTILKGASGPVFQRHLRAVGIGPANEVPLMGAVHRAYEWFGESWLSMQVTRQSGRMTKGWPEGSVHTAAVAAAEELVDMVQPFVPALLDTHRKAGRLLVLATTSPIHLVAPLAERLGFDDVLATRWSSQDGQYTGTFEGPFVWGREKLKATLEWAKANAVDLKTSFFYSDSYFDGPLLAAVGNPVAVNPDPQLAVLARLRGWPVRHLDVSPGVAKVAGRELQDWLRPFNRPELVPNARFEFEGVENIPATGPAIVVFNHRSYFDASAVNLLIAKSGRCARFLGKKEVFDVPVVGAISRLFGGIRVVRASGSDEPLEAAADALAGGELVSMAPQGTIPRGPAFFDPVLKGRWGAARLAAMTGAPVIPVGLWGTEVVWPRNSRLPHFSLERPLIQVKVGPAVELHRQDPDEDTRAIMAAIVDLLPPEARRKHKPTEEELARTYPPGYRGDAAKEAERRPGVDTVPAKAGAKR
jgi:putative phosphoserine phosphatase/1-acylglycerol-3-phosphate O-acyltransferase